MRRPLAICCKISALGRRSPRSTWLRYGLEMPAADASWRSEIFACSRCWRMYSPMELTLTGLTFSVNHIVLAIASGEQARGERSDLHDQRFSRLPAMDPASTKPAAACGFCPVLASCPACVPETPE